MEALLKTIPNTAKNFQNDAQRNSIMNSISIGIDTNDEEIVKISLQALSEVPFIGYHQILPYLEKIGELTHRFLTS